jgi:hypothetical protein
MNMLHLFVARWARLLRSLSERSFLFAAVLLTGIFLSCSPRDFLTRRLASDLISASDPFKSAQQFTLQTGVVSSKSYPSPEYLVLQRHGWISATPFRCPANLTPPPCWDILMTPSGVDTIRTMVSSDETGKPTITLPVARRALLEVTGISKQDGTADVEFTWKWTPLNEIGAALYSGDLRYKSLVGFRQFDDGWRVAQSSARSGQPLDDALKNAEPVP